MKQRWILFAGVLVLLVGGYFATGAGVAQAVPVPQQVNLFLNSLVFAAVGAGFVWLFNVSGIDLKQFTEPVSAVLSLWVIAELQDIVNLIPAAYDGYVSFVFQVIVILLGGAGTLYLLAKHRNSESLLG